MEEPLPLPPSSEMDEEASLPPPPFPPPLNPESANVRRLRGDEDGKKNISYQEHFLSLKSKLASSTADMVATVVENSSKKLPTYYTRRKSEAEQQVQRRASDKRDPSVSWLFQCPGGYIVTVWNRSSSFDVASLPRALTCDAGGTAELVEMDAPQCVAWVFEPWPTDRGIPVQPHQGLLRASVPSARSRKPQYLTPELSLTTDVEAAAVWDIELWKPFRGGYLDVSVRLRLGNKLLCSQVVSSNPDECGVMLLTERQANVKREAKERGDIPSWAYNDAWECVPDAVADGDNN